MILFNPTSSYLWLNQGTEVNKNSTSYTSVVSPQKKKKKKKEEEEKKNKIKLKKGSGARLHNKSKGGLSVDLYWFFSYSWILTNP